MTAKQDVIDYCTVKFAGDNPLLQAVLSMIQACEADGLVTQLRAAYIEKDPDVEFTNSEAVASGANYDYGENKITIKPGGQALDLADNLIFESFNCAHRQEYLDLRTRFNANSFPPMFFMDFGKAMASIEGKVTYEYLSLLREIGLNSPVDTPHADGAKRTLVKNSEVNHEDQMIARMQWTSHAPGGEGDWRFPTPEHYAFQKVMDMNAGQAWYRIKCLIIAAAGGNRLGDYNKLDYNMRFQKWARDEWTPLARTAKPTSFITMCQEANRVFPPASGGRWRPITLQDYQFSTMLELEARRLQKRAVLTRAPGVV